MVATRQTKIMLNAMIGNADLPEYLRCKTSELGLSHSESISYAADYIEQVVAASMNGSTMPDFASEILVHTLVDLVDWRYVAEALLVTAEAN